MFYIHIDKTRIDKSGSKKVLGFAVEDSGQVRETLLLLLLSTRFAYSRCIIFIRSLLIETNYLMMRGDWESWKKARVSDLITTNTFSFVRPMLSSRECIWTSFLSAPLCFHFTALDENSNREIPDERLIFTDRYNERVSSCSRFVNIFVSCPFTEYYTFVAYTWHYPHLHSLSGTFRVCISEFRLHTGRVPLSVKIRLLVHHIFGSIPGSFN